MADDAAGPEQSPAPYRWQGQEPGSAASALPGARRRLRFFLLTGAFLALLSAAIVLILCIRLPTPTPFLLTISIADYNDRHYPVRPFARQDGVLLLQHFPERMREQPVTNSWELLPKKLKGLKESSARSLIVHITALALVRDDKVYLLPGDAEPDNPKTWLDVRDVVAWITECPAPEKLLILDVAHPLVDPRLGVLTDRVAQTLEDYLRKETPPFNVLCSCSGGQLSLTSEVLQCSVFAHYLDQGLQGHADVNKHGRVTVQNLAEFVKLRVDRWAQQNRHLRQEPRLLGKGVDFTIVRVSEDMPAAREKPKLEAYPDALLKGWTERDAAWDLGAFQRAPRLLQKLDARLLRQEKRWRGGAGVTALDKESQDLFQELKHAMRTPEPGPRSLALGTKGNQALADSIFRTLTKEAADKKEIGKIEEELAKKLTGEKDADDAQKAWAVVEAMYRIPLPTQDQLQLARSVLASLKGKQPFVEVMYVRRLAEFSKGHDSQSWPSEKVRAVLLTLRAHQALLAALERAPECRPWIAPAVEAADRLRQAGERKLLLGRAPTWVDALRELQSAREIYEQQKKAVERLQGGRLELDRAFALLPGYLTLLCDWPEDDAQAQEAWCSAARDAAFLQTYFTDGPRADQADAKLESAAGKLKQHLDALDESLRMRIIAVEKGDTAKVQQQLRCLLDYPLLKAPDRKALVSRQRALAIKLHDTTDELDQEDNRLRRLVRLPDAVPARPEKNAGAQRASMSLASLRLGAIESKEWRLECPPAQDQVKDLNALEKSLRELWGPHLLERLRKAGPDPAGDALNRLASPWEHEEIVGAAQRDYSCLWLTKVRESYLDWLKGCYQSEARFWEIAPADPDARGFYLDAARKLRPN